MFENKQKKGQSKLQPRRGFKESENSYRSFVSPEPPLRGFQSPEPCLGGISSPTSSSGPFMGFKSPDLRYELDYNGTESECSFRSFASPEPPFRGFISPEPGYLSPGIQSPDAGYRSGNNSFNTLRSHETGYLSPGLKSPDTGYRSGNNSFNTISSKESGCQSPDFGRPRSPSGYLSPNHGCGSPISGEVNGHGARTGRRSPNPGCQSPQLLPKTPMGPGGPVCKQLGKQRTGSGYMSPVGCHSPDPSSPRIRQLKSPIFGTSGGSENGYSGKQITGSGYMSPDPGSPRIRQLKSPIYGNGSSDAGHSPNGSRKSQFLEFIQKINLKKNGNGNLSEQTIALARDLISPEESSRKTKMKNLSNWALCLYEFF